MRNTNSHSTFHMLKVSLINGWTFLCASVCEPLGYQPCSHGASARCCDAFGNLLTTSFGCHVTTGYKNTLGYCNAGRCAADACAPKKGGMSLPVFCGASKINPCKASCSAEVSSKCYDTVILYRFWISLLPRVFSQRAQGNKTEANREYIENKQASDCWT